MQPNDKVEFTFSSKTFLERGPGWMYFRPAQKNTEDVLDLISKSNSTGSSTDTFCLEVTSVRVPEGRGGNGRTCPCCQEAPPCDNTDNKQCDDCNRQFRGSNCYDKHKQSGMCNEVRKCNSCSKTIKSGRKHVCGAIFCKICGSNQAEDHLCFMQVDKRKVVTKDVLFVFYDIETQQETNEPNLCVFEQRCDKCIGLENIIRCNKCGTRLQILKKSKKLDFIRHLLKTRRKFKEVVVIAHNGQAFDYQFLLKCIIQETDLTPKFIMRDTKFIMMQIDNVKFIDSLNYFAMPLSSLPKTFNLQPSLKKGYFPYLFNTERNENYIGKLPPIEYYSPDTMKGTDDATEDDDRKRFLKWHEETTSSNYVFDMKKELVEYCTAKVQILTQACLEFRNMLLTSVKVCPFTEAVTIASVGNLVFRRNFLQPNTIGILPKGGYRWKDNQSEIAIKWLLWEENQRKIDIQHLPKKIESKVPGVKVDGYCEKTRQIFEFHRCYFHGHPECLKHCRGAPLPDDPNDTLEKRYERTVAKTESLRRGYEVIEIWECNFHQKIQTMHTEELDYLNNNPLLLQTPLNPRDCFYGGRTGNTRTYYKIKPGEKIKYIDICSLYPYICKYGKFPIGHPTIHVGPDKCSKVNIQTINGIIKCKILPPQNLYHPVLPSKIDKMLLFALCCTCAKKKIINECNHNRDQRALTGTWVLDEIRQAQEKGYEILEIYEIWEYTTQQFNPSQDVAGLFTGMMNKFFKVKQEASGWPSEYSTQERRDKYIVDFLNKEGVELNPENILKNPGLRSLAKLMLNSFWGKLGQRENQPKTTIVRESDDFYALITNPTININYIFPINKVIAVNWEYKEETGDIQSTANVCIAAYVTTQARLKLYGYLEKLDKRVLYYDTDSVIYISRDGEDEPPTGCFFGDMKDELEGEFGPGSYITEFVSGGPKNYAYTVYSTNKQAHVERRKMKRPVCEKRRFTDDGDSTPYGYKKLRVSSAI